MAAISPSVGGSIDWAALRDFVAKNEAYESRVGQPAPLTDSQRDAINTLLLPPPQPAGQDKDFNWIGCLLEWCQKAQVQGPPAFSMEPVSRPGKGVVIYWRCTCDIPPTGRPSVLVNTFPCEGFGIDPGGQLPTFARKQDAKTFAARMACEYLNSKGLLGLPARFAYQKPQPQAPVAPAGPPAVVGRTPEPQATDQDDTEGGVTVSSINPGSQLSLTHALESSLGDPVPVTRQVSDLAKQLGLPSPQYHASQEPRLGFWKGVCDFQFNPHFPDGLGSVTGASTEKEAKQMMAEGVLRWLQGEQKKRAKITQDFIGEDAA